MPATSPFHLAKVTMSRQMLVEILWLIARLRRLPWRVRQVTTATMRP